jgi:hypothetical protein
VAGLLLTRPRGWLADITTVALDPWPGDASALVASLPDATVVVDRFRPSGGQHNGRPGPPTRPAGHPGHRGRKPDPQYRIASCC